MEFHQIVYSFHHNHPPPPPNIPVSLQSLTQQHLYICKRGKCGKYILIPDGKKEEGQEKLKKETPELFVELKARSSLVTQWLGFLAFTAMVQVQSLVRELRSCKLPGSARKKKKKKKAKKKHWCIHPSFSGPSPLSYKMVYGATGK